MLSLSGQYECAALSPRYAAEPYKSPRELASLQKPYIQPCTTINDQDVTTDAPRPITLRLFYC